MLNLSRPKLYRLIVAASLLALALSPFFVSVVLACGKGSGGGC